MSIVNSSRVLRTFRREKHFVSLCSGPFVSLSKIWCTSLALVNLQLPDYIMTQKGGSEMVLEAMPSLDWLSFTFVGDNRKRITSVVLDLPMLDYLHVEKGTSVKTCKFNCPKLESIHYDNCGAMPVPPSTMAGLRKIISSVSLFSFMLSMSIQLNTLQLASLYMGGSMPHLSKVLVVIVYRNGESSVFVRFM